ncbi:glycoside hydrolase family 3 N-terminal domain-containing protein [uncultured Desulfovibrio sp.]|uniref:glycoside hydrolase family 3 protein n=1 Tax=uncultured Desulfovibrio sp. TaxID=167968 RepID=UPI00262530F1|nr:glycoside hydrolase family 3 N-terminal domain-containing protein [uncultured Desulfovibrio sp.]
MNGQMARLSLIAFILAFLLALLPHLARGATPGEPVLSPERMVGSMLMLGFRGIQEADDPVFWKALRAGRVGHVLLFDKDTASGGLRNIRSPQQLRGLTAALRQAAPLTPFIAVDDEGGNVRRCKPAYGFSALPSASLMGRERPERTWGRAEQLGRELRSVGVNVNLAPVADVNTNPGNPVIARLGRSFSPSPQTVSLHAWAFGQGLAAEGVIPVLKHFPGHGSSRFDTHRGTADITETWQAAELQPFRDCFGAGWPGMVMVGHVSHRGMDARLPASLSPAVIEDLLRGQMGWQGVVISDDLMMDAVARRFTLKQIVLLAVAAGNDILVFGNNTAQPDPDLPEKVHAAFMELVRDGSIPLWRIQQSWERIEALRQALGVPLRGACRRTF